MSFDWSLSAVLSEMGGAICSYFLFTLAVSQLRVSLLGSTHFEAVHQKYQFTEVDAYLLCRLKMRARF